MNDKLKGLPTWKLWIVMIAVTLLLWRRQAINAWHDFLAMFNSPPPGGAA